MTTYADAKTAQTSAEVRDDTLLPACETQGCDVSGWPTIAPQRGLVEGSARVLAYEQSLRAKLAKTASPDDAIDAGSTWVDAVMGWFDLDNGTGGKGRILATKAVWDIPLQVTTAAAPVTIDSSSTILLQSTGGIVFECAQTTAVTLNAASTYKGTASFRARAAGTTGNVSPGAIAKVISGPAGLSVDLTGTQTQTTSARDEETSADFIARGLGRWGTLGAGWTLTSFDFLIPQYASTVTRWRVRDDNPDGPGTVHVYLANASGAASADEVSAVSDGLGLTSVKPLGSGAITVDAATVHALVITATIRGDGSNASLQTDAQDAIAALIAAFPLGPATLTPSLVTSVLMGRKNDPDAGDAITIQTGATSEGIQPDLPGFTGAESVTALSLAADETLASGEVLTVSITVTVA